MKTHLDRLPYHTDVSDEQGALVEPLIPPVKPGDRPLEYSKREVLNGILYLDRTGCGWRPLPHYLPLCRTIFHHFIKMVDQAKARGRNEGRKVPVRKRHLLVDTLRLILAIEIAAANVIDPAGFRLIFNEVLTIIGLGWVRLVWADSVYGKPGLLGWVKEAFAARALSLRLELTGGAHLWLAGALSTVDP